MKKVLHITNWYPNKWDDIEAIFIKEQFNLFSKVTQSHLINVQVREGKRLLKYEYVKYSHNEEGYYLLTKIKSNKIRELLTTFLLLWVLFKSRYKQYDILHFHIAYPLLIHYFLWKKIIKLPIIISEHWSAYHFNFYMSKETKKLDWIKRIFKQGIPLVTVSTALLKDIEKFSNIKQKKYVVVPNVIDQKVFYYRNNFIKDTISTFFAVNNWRKIKNPFPMLEGFKELYKKNIEFKLVLGGYGELIEPMKSFIEKNNFLNKVLFLGKMNKQEIADSLSQSDAYVFSSTYETFSVVNAQSLCCGVPIIGPKLIAVEEYAKEDSFIALEENNSTEWQNKLIYFIKNRDKYHREEIANKINIYLSNQQIKNIYKDTINEWAK